MRTAKVEQQSNQRMKEGGVDGCAIIQDGGGGTHRTRHEKGGSRNGE